MPAVDAKRALVVIPTYNEASNIETVINRIFALNAPTIEILIVDDNSPDGTGEFVAKWRKTEPRLHLLQRPGKMGLGTAYVAGFRYAVQNGFEYIFEMDADLSHNPDDLPRLLENTDCHDLVIGSRYLKGGESGQLAFVAFAAQHFCKLVYARHHPHANLRLYQRL